MDVPGGANARRNNDLDEAEGPSGIVPTDLDRFEHSEEPEGFAFLLTQRVSELCSLNRNLSHEVLLASGCVISLSGSEPWSRRRAGSGPVSSREVLLPHVTGASYSPWAASGSPK